MIEEIIKPKSWMSDNESKLWDAIIALRDELLHISQQLKKDSNLDVIVNEETLNK